MRSPIWIAPLPRKYLTQGCSCVCLERLKAARFPVRRIAVAHGLRLSAWRCLCDLLVCGHWLSRYVLRRFYYCCPGCPSVLQAAARHFFCWCHSTSFSQLLFGGIDTISAHGSIDNVLLSTADSCHFEQGLPRCSRHCVPADDLSATGILVRPRALRVKLAWCARSRCCRAFGIAFAFCC